MDDVMSFFGEESFAIADTPIPRSMVMADVSKPRPMVNSKLLRKYMGRRVTTVVKVLRVEGGNAVGEMPDGVPITVHRAPQHVAAQSLFMEVIGVVESDRFLRAQTCTGFGDDFDEHVPPFFCSVIFHPKYKVSTCTTRIVELPQHNTGTGFDDSEFLKSSETKPIREQIDFE